METGAGRARKAGEGRVWAEVRRCETGVCYLEELRIDSRVSPAEATCLLMASKCEVTYGASSVSLLSPPLAGLQMSQASGLGLGPLLSFSILPPGDPHRP